VIQYIAGIIGAATLITNEPIFKLMGIAEYTLFIVYIATKPEKKAMK
jgi:hypothetical protein